MKNRQDLAEAAGQTAPGGWAPPGADHLRAGARRLGRAATAAAGTPPSRLAPVVEDALDFLLRGAIPRLEAEREVLHPILERALGRLEGADALRSELAEIRIQTERLDSLAQRAGGALLGRSDRQAVGRILADLSRLLLGHLEREASLWAAARAALPELDARQETLARTMEEAERRALGAVVLVVQPAVHSQAAVVMRHNPAAGRAYAVTLADMVQGADHAPDRPRPSQVRDRRKTTSKSPPPSALVSWEKPIPPSTS